MDENDIEVDKIMPEDKEKDHAEKRYVTKNHDVSRDPLNMFKRDDNAKLVFVQAGKKKQ